MTILGFIAYAARPAFQATYQASKKDSTSMKYPPINRVENLVEYDGNRPKRWLSPDHKNVVDKYLVAVLPMDTFMCEWKRYKDISFTKRYCRYQGFL